MGEFLCKSAHSVFKVTHMTSEDVEGQRWEPLPRPKQVLVLILYKWCGPVYAPVCIRWFASMCENYAWVSGANRPYTAESVSGEGHRVLEVLCLVHLSVSSLLQPVLFCASCRLDILNLPQPWRFA